MSKGPKPRPIYERMMDKVHFVPDAGCWVFTGNYGQKGHGNIGE